MFQRDHIMRQVRQLAAALARAIQLRRAGQIGEAEELVRGTLKQSVELDVVTLLTLPLDQVLDEIRARGAMHGDLLVGVADALYEYALLQGTQESGLGDAARQRAIEIYVECIRANYPVPLHAMERVGTDESVGSPSDSVPNPSAVPNPDMTSIRGDGDE
ncbi:MAG: hypothetical protein HKN13_12500 [Rhodothermales bacterium]|nr:hypothetical protein [Rhodothermales bacterium]